MQTTASTKLNDHARLIEDSALIIRKSVARSFRYYYYATDKDEIDDICQQILLLLIEDSHRRLRLFDSQKSSFQTWLNSIVRHHISNYIHRRRETMSLDEIDPESVSSPPTQEHLVILRDRSRRLEATLTRLSKRDQQIIQLLYIEELSAIDVARIMRIKVGLVYWHKHAVIKRLRNICNKF